MNRLSDAVLGQEMRSAKRIAALLVACSMFSALPGQLRAEFLTPEDVGVAGEIGITWPRIVYHTSPSGDVYEELISESKEDSFGVVPKYHGALSGATDLGGAQAGISITPLMGRLYAKAVAPVDPNVYLAPAGVASVMGTARETVELTVPDGWNSSPMLRVDYRLTARLEVNGSQEFAPRDPLEPVTAARTQAEFSAFLGSDFKVETPLGYLPSDFTATQDFDGVQSIDTTISGWIQSVATEDPNVWIASWLWGMRGDAQSVFGTALVDATHTMELASLTFANGQTFEELGVTVRFLSGREVADDLTLPPDGNGPQPVPEPAPLTMLGSGVIALLGFFAFRRRATVLKGTL